MKTAKADGFRALAEALRAREPGLRAEGLRGSSRAYVLARVLRELGRSALVLTSTLTEARTFAKELAFFLGSAPRGTQLPWDPAVVLFPAWETMPFEAIPPLPEVTARRIASLFRARHRGPFACIAPVTAALQRTFPPEVFDQATLLASVGEEIDREVLARRLVDAGYHRVGQVEERGEASLRGGIVDVYPPHYSEPLRIELFGDEIESIRTFDPGTQRSTGRLSEAVILPAREVVASEEALEGALRRLRRRCRELGYPLSKTSEVLESLRSTPAVRDVFLPYFYERAVPLREHFPADTLLVYDEQEKVGERAAEFLAEAALGYERALERGQATPALEDVYLSREAWDGMAAGAPSLALEELEVARPGPSRTFGFSTSSNRDLTETLRQKKGNERLLGPLVAQIEAAREKNEAMLLVARSPGSARRIQDLLGAYGIEIALEETASCPVGDGTAGLRLCLGNLDRGFRFPAERLVIVTETEILGEKVRRPRFQKRGAFQSSLGELEVGEPIVHADFGIGLYRGLVRLSVQGEEGDYLHLEYADGDRLYLPVTRIGLVKKYAAPGEGLPRLDKLGGRAWEKTRAKALEGIERMAHELLDLYARRQVAERLPYPSGDLAYREFEATFPYEETPDQAAAIADVLDDMKGSRPMDRVICGDVGYGKTEVAIRAAMLAVLGGRQVAVLVPTTVLAAQHFQNFGRRFDGYPIHVEMLSRFVSAADQKQVCSRIAEGKVDIVVGTHRILQRDLRFKDLGLVVVDEEHRFGVAQKERMKKLRAQVDFLTLSATPIPRTLHMGFSGVRDLSIIETPPADRLAVRTLLARFDDDLVREAIRRELNRGGQVYFVHNRVQSIGALAEHLRTLVPEAKIGVGHGQMAEGELEKVMKGFVEGGIEILVCTAIIESGLDIPRANTILINRADQFGLADLYQLRGRVGRSNLRAYAYLLVPGETELTPDARKRLQALQEFTELGAGFKIATHDLEIRGAGELLGEAQSGHITAIGFDLYAELLEEAVRTLKGEHVEKAPEPEIHLRVPAHFPVDYVDDPKQRLALYEKLTRAPDEASLDEIRYELVDRYGPLPAEVENLLEVMKVRLLLVGLRAEGLDYNGRDLIVSLSETSAVDPDKIIRLVQDDPTRYRLTPDHRFKSSVGSVETNRVFEAARDVLLKLG
ncbi:MAG: transcription-repair coupling factor [Deltaproteobacteria bacterium]|nr:transcription-repair coupling factor [Deltaproteobacteria bacterium]